MSSNECAYCHPEDKRRLFKALDENGQLVMVHEDEHAAYTTQVVRKQLAQSEVAVADMAERVAELRRLLAAVEDDGSPEGECVGVEGD